MRKTTLFCAALCLLLLAFAPARAKAVERYEVLMQGDKDQYVFRLQEELHARGYLTVEPTGYFGTETRRALIRYQSRHGLEADGKAGPKTLQKIYGKNYRPMPSTREVSDSKAPESDNPDALRLGDEGSVVKKAQTRLKELGYYKYSKLTTYYGPITESAVISFQKRNGLKADGVIGEKTSALLYSSKAKKASSSSSSNTSAGLDKEANADKSKSKVTRAIETAKSLMGKRYRWGATGPNSFDCSGFIKYVLNAVGVSTPRTSSEMSKNTAWKKIEGTKNLKKGDLLFFSTGSKKVGHVGMYLGGGKFIHCSSGKAMSVTISELSGSYSRRYQWARRCF